MIKKMTIAGLIACLALLTASGCTKEDEKKTTATTELEGTWIQSCSDGGDGTSTSMNVAISSYALTANMGVFTDAVCGASNVAMTVAMTNSFSFPTPAEATAPAGAKKIDLVSGAISVTLKSDLMVTAFNSSSECGKTDWAVNTPVQTNSLTCSSLPSDPIGTKSYTIYKLDTTKLYLGKSDQTHDESADDKRANVLETEALNKQ